jgi:PIN like domain
VRIRTDEHVSPAIVEVIRALALSSGWELTSVLDFDRGADDVHWIARFARESGDAIISGDTDFLKVPQQVSAVFATGMKVIHLPSRWSNAKGHLQAAHLLLWWPRIEAKIATMNSRQCFRPSWNINETGELAQVSIDFQTAQRKARRASRRGDSPPG